MGNGLIYAVARQRIWMLLQAGLFLTYFRKYMANNIQQMDKYAMCPIGYCSGGKILVQANPTL